MLWISWLSSQPNTGPFSMKAHWARPGAMVRWFAVVGTVAVPKIWFVFGSIFVMVHFVVEPLAILVITNNDPPHAYKPVGIVEASTIAWTSVRSCLVKIFGNEGGLSMPG